MTTDEAIKFANDLKNNYTIDLSQMENFCNMAIHALENNKWIPCSERIPENYADVIFCDRQGTVFFGHYNKYCDYWCADFCDDRIKSVVAWMPKPESYHE